MVINETEIKIDHEKGSENVDKFFPKLNHRFGIIYIVFSIHPKCSKVYVGQTTQPKDDARFADHLNNSLKSDSPVYDYKLSRAIRKYGKSTWKILRVDQYILYLKKNHLFFSFKNPYLKLGKSVKYLAINQSDLDDLEILWIDELDSFHHGYNQTLGGAGRRIAEALSKAELQTYLSLLRQGYMKSQIFSSHMNSKIFKDKNSPLNGMSYSQFCLKLAYSQLTDSNLEQIAFYEIVARFYANSGRQSGLANIIAVEKIMGLDHFSEISANKKRVNQDLSLLEIKSKFSQLSSFDSVLANFNIQKSLYSKIKPDPNLSLGRIGDIRTAILIDLFENNRFFSKSYLNEEYKSTRDIIKSSPIQKGMKRIYDQRLALFRSWEVISLEISPELTDIEILKFRTTFRKISNILIPKAQEIKQYLSNLEDDLIITTRDLAKKFNISRNYLSYITQVFSPALTLRMNSKKWENYRRLIFIENMLINIPFISPRLLSKLFFSTNFTESDRKNFSRKLNLVKYHASSGNRASRLYLDDEITLI